MDSVNQPTVSQTEPTLPAPADFPAEGMASAASVPAPAPAPSDPPGVPPTQRNIATNFGADLISSLQSLMGTVVIAIFVITFIVQAFQIPSESMENTLLVGDYLLVNKLCYGGAGLGDHVMPYQKIRRGDIIVFYYPVEPQQPPVDPQPHLVDPQPHPVDAQPHFVKRVIGLPGDRLRMMNKRVLINGKPLDEPYVRLEPGSDLYRDDFPRTDIPAPSMKGFWWKEMRKLVEDGELIIPQGNYFVMGDNRDNSDDSRYWGFVPQENVIGRPLLIYWSVQDWDSSPASTMPERLQHLSYAVTHLFQITRWNRTFRLIH